jgi:hypothetical protein
VGDLALRPVGLGCPPRPWLAVPGNHDISPFHLWQRFFHPFRRYRRYIAPETEPVFQDDEIAVVCLNTVRTWAPETDRDVVVARHRQPRPGQPGHEGLRLGVLAAPRPHGVPSRRPLSRSRP